MCRADARRSWWWNVQGEFFVRHVCEVSSPSARGAPGSRRTGRRDVFSEREVQSYFSLLSIYLFFLHFLFLFFKFKRECYKSTKDRGEYPERVRGARAWRWMINSRRTIPSGRIHSSFSTILKYSRAFWAKIFRLRIRAKVHLRRVLVLLLRHPM